MTIFCRKYKHDPINLLEIGIQNGGSLEVFFSKYFKKAKTLVGCDSDKNCNNLSFSDNRISLIIGNCTKKSTVNKIKSECQSFDIIIDDGSHTSEDIIKSFCIYFPMLKNNGIYIVEDLHCSYWKEYGGGIFDMYSSIAFFKSLIDNTSYDQWGIDAPPSITSNFFSLIFINVR